MPPVSLLLRMLKWITINFTCASQQEPCTNPLCQTQHIQGSHDICLVLIVKWPNFPIRNRAREISHNTEINMLQQGVALPWHSHKAKTI
jgi:hypothetical protein